MYVGDSRDRSSQVPHIAVAPPLPILGLGLGSHAFPHVQRLASENNAYKRSWIGAQAVPLTCIFSADSATTQPL